MKKILLIACAFLLGVAVGAGAMYVMMPTQSNEMYQEGMPEGMMPQDGQMPEGMEGGRPEGMEGGRPEGMMPPEGEVPMGEIPEGAAL